MEKIDWSNSSDSSSVVKLSGIFFVFHSISHPVPTRKVDKKKSYTNAPQNNRRVVNESSIKRFALLRVQLIAFRFPRRLFHLLIIPSKRGKINPNYWMKIISFDVSVTQTEPNEQAITLEIPFWLTKIKSRMQIAKAQSPIMCKCITGDENAVQFVLMSIRKAFFSPFPRQFVCRMDGKFGSRKLKIIHQHSFMCAIII